MAVTKFIRAEEAVRQIKSGDKVFVHGSAATPLYLLRALSKRGEELRNVELISISTLGDIAVNHPDFKESFYFNSLFVSENIRECVNNNQGDYVPVFLSEIPTLFHRKIIVPDVALIHVSPRDRHGYCSLGVSVDVARAAVKYAKKVIAQVNPRMPRTMGDGVIHHSEISAMVYCEEELPEVHYDDDLSETELAIGKNIASMVEDGSTLQLGIGTIPDAVLRQLLHCKDLGLHTEMFSDGVLDLIDRGIINNKHKRKHRGKVTTSFAIGSRKLYDYVDDNPTFAFLEADYVNDTSIIRANPKVVAINSAIEIDITGQVCSDSIGTLQYSGVGGQMDFIRGAALSEGGKPIIAMPSVTKKGKSKIVPFLTQGAGVVTTRAHVHFIVTEFGIADLFGKNLKQRAQELIRIAHPDHREELERATHERFKC
jgi:acyl-CoA hydrolase